MNQIRLICKEGDRGSLKVLSSLCGSYVMEARTDEKIEFLDDTLVVIKNLRNDRCRIKLKGFKGSRPRSGVIVAPGRQATRTLREGLWESLDITLGPEEALTLRSGDWKAPHGAGQMGAV